MTQDTDYSPQHTALITGASRGLGLALARQLAHLHWHLLIDARGEEALETARVELSQWTTVTALAGDVSEDTHRQDLAALVRSHGRLDALINNASFLGASPLPFLYEYPLAVLEQVYRTNVLAPLGLIQAVRPYLAAGACIINVTSDAGVEGYQGWGGYGSSKAALEQLSHILSVEDEATRIYWVDPGDMRTEMHQDAFPGENIDDRPLPEESVPGFLKLLTGSYVSGRYSARALS